MSKLYRDNTMIHRGILDAMHRMYRAKNEDYGNSFGEMYEEEGFPVAYIKITDKYKRIKRLRNNDAKVQSESMEDTLMDLANYCIMTLMEMEKAKDVSHTNVKVPEPVSVCDEDCEWCMQESQKHNVSEEYEDD